MFHPHQKVRKACAKNLDDLVELREAYHILMGKHPRSREQLITVRSFLKSLPPARKQKKIIRRFRKMAKARRCIATDFQWWDIIRGQRILFVTVHRNSRDITLAFFWKKTEEGTDRSRVAMPSSCWARNEGSKNWRFEFEAQTYQEVKAQYRHWLAHPIPPTPDVAPTEPPTPDPILAAPSVAPRRRVGSELRRLLHAPPSKVPVPVLHWIPDAQSGNPPSKPT